MSVPSGNGSFAAQKGQIRAPFSLTAMERFLEDSNKPVKD
jgi:hypothetical protein